MRKFTLLGVVGIAMIIGYISYVSLSIPTSVSCSTTSDSSEPTIHVWEGLQQQVGKHGIGQSDFNLIGHLSGPSPIAYASYVLNDGQPQKLTVGDRPDGYGDGRRLASTCDFNADIPIEQFNEGPNTVVLSAIDENNHETHVIVNIEKYAGTATLPITIDWQHLASPQEVGHAVDGHWVIDSTGLQIVRPGYDRLFLIGDDTWQDYEVTVPVTVFGFDQKPGPRSGGGNAFGLGILMRFTGHMQGGPLDWPDVPPHLEPYVWEQQGVLGPIRYQKRLFDYTIAHRSSPKAQPKWGYLPFGAIGWLRWRNGTVQNPIGQFHAGDENRANHFDEIDIALRHRYWMKMRSKTLPDEEDGKGVTTYSWKVWPDGEDEPIEWNWEVTQSSHHALRKGGFALLAHHVEASFGAVSVVSI